MRPTLRTTGVLVSFSILALFAGAGAARAARPPAASDSAFSELSAQPLASLNASELAWLGVQRRWRAERFAPASREFRGKLFMT